VAGLPGKEFVWKITTKGRYMNFSISGFSAQECPLFQVKMGV